LLSKTRIEHASPSPQGELEVKTEMTCADMLEEFTIAEIKGKRAEQIEELLDENYILQVERNSDGHLVIKACKP
jgi:hypothetical protein